MCLHAYVDGSDFLFASRNITFLAGSVSSMFNVTINDDDMFEINEAFNLILFIIPSQRPISVPNDTTTVFIIDNDRKCERQTV